MRSTAAKEEASRSLCEPVSHSPSIGPNASETGAGRALGPLPRGASGSALRAFGSLSRDCSGAVQSRSAMPSKPPTEPDLSTSSALRHTPRSGVNNSVTASCGGVPGVRLELPEGEIQCRKQRKVCPFGGLFRSGSRKTHLFWEEKTRRPQKEGGAAGGFLNRLNRRRRSSQSAPRSRRCSVSQPRTQWCP